MATYTTNPYKNINPISGGGKDVYNKEYAKAAQAAQAAQEAAIAQAQSNIARTNNQLINAYNAQNATPKVYIHTNDASISNASPATLIQQPTANPNGGGGGTYQQSTAVQANPYADLMAIYQQRLDAQNAANEQRRAARLGALQSNYANAKSRLSDAFNSGETALNTDADNALRESYINMMLNQRRLNQQLESQGINGGAMESSLARAYNDYGNSRNNIEQGRMDALRELLSQYQGQLGDMESAYASNLADLDSDYFGNGLDFVTDYYDAIAALQKQNAASNLQAQLGKRSSGSAATNDSGLDSNILSVGKNYKGNAIGYKRYLDAVGVPEGQQSLYQMSVGNDPDVSAAIAQAENDKQQSILDSIDSNIYDRFMNYVGGKRNQIYSGDEKLMAALQSFGRQYGLTEEQMRALLAEASRR